MAHIRWWFYNGTGPFKSHHASALIASLAFILFTYVENFRTVILVTSLFTFFSGGLVWFYIPGRSPEKSGVPVSEVIDGIKKLLGHPNTWLLAIIIICAYAGYKITDDFSLFAREVLGFSERHAAGVGTVALWLRALVAILAGYLADRFSRCNVITLSFALTLIGGLLVAFRVFEGFTGLLLLNLGFTAAGIYGIRALYFAVLNEAGFPVALTGTAVGIVSFAGFAPEIFISPWMGHLLDQNPGATGHARVFLLLSFFALVGLSASLLFRRFSLR